MTTSCDWNSFVYFWTCQTLSLYISLVDFKQNCFDVLWNLKCDDFAVHSDREILIEFQKLGLKVFRPPSPKKGEGWSPASLGVHILRKIWTTAASRLLWCWSVALRLEFGSSIKRDFAGDFFCYRPGLGRRISDFYEMLSTSRVYGSVVPGLVH